MLGFDILELIRHRRDHFEQQLSATDNTRDLERIRSMIAEYDSLLADAEVLAHEHFHPHAVPKIEDEPSEQWILGDQGQSGG